MKHSYQIGLETLLSNRLVLVLLGFFQFGFVVVDFFSGRGTMGFDSTT